MGRTKKGKKQTNKKEANGYSAEWTHGNRDIRENRHVGASSAFFHLEKHIQSSDMLCDLINYYLVLVHYMKVV